MTSSDKKQRKMLKTQYMAFSVYSDPNLNPHRQTEQNQIETQKNLWKDSFHIFLSSRLSLHSYLFNSVIKNSTASRHGKF